MDSFPPAPDPESGAFIDPALLQTPSAEPLAPMPWAADSQTIFSDDDINSGGLGFGLGSAGSLPRPLLSMAFPVPSYISGVAF
jgi:hypothetical protein